MGCGSSSLKGEKVEDLSATSQPVKRVQTNFSEVDFTGDANANRRGKSFAVAPDEQQRRPTRISETGVEDPHPSLPGGDGIVADTQQHHTADGAKHVPYHDPDGKRDDLASPVSHTSQTQGLTKASDPTSATAKSEFANSNQPASSTTKKSQEGALLSPTSALQGQAEKPRKKSLYARYQDRVTGRAYASISDEEMKKTFGMTRAEFDAWAADPKNGVGRHQSAQSSIAYGGIGVGIGYSM